MGHLRHTVILARVAEHTAMEPIKHGHYGTSLGCGITATFRSCLLTRLCHSLEEEDGGAFNLGGQSQHQANELLI